MSSVAVYGSVVLEWHDQPLVDAVVETIDDARPTGGLLQLPSKANRPAEGLWFIPHFKADKLNPGDTTYFSVRNESLLPSEVTVEYFDVRSALQTTQRFELESRRLKNVALRLVPNLPIAGDGYTRGFARISTFVPVTVDSYQLETRNAFAVGGLGFTTDDFCTRWNARFLKFESAGGTILTVMVNGPQGNRPNDLVTLAGDVYTEAGEFVGSFSIRTDEWSMEIPIHDLIPQGVDFGVVELVVNSVYLPAGIIEIRHQALGRYSVGHWAVCTD
jgi:hypothetical protein